MTRLPAGGDLATGTVASGDFLTFSDISDGGLLKKVAVTDLIDAAGTQASQTITTLTTSNIVGPVSFTGANTLDSPNVYDHNTTITAFATGGQASAVALTGEFNNVTVCATAGDSVKLLTAVAGQTQTVKNSGAATLAVFPNTSDSIDGLAVNLSVDVPVDCIMTFRAISATVWETQESFYSSAPTTQRGGLELKAVDNAANYKVTVSNASFGQSSVVSIPDVGAATGTFATLEATQTFSGTKTFSAIKRNKATNAITAFASGGQASAVALTSEINSITVCATAGDSVKLPTSVAGMKIQVSNLGAAHAAVFPISGDLIDGLAANASVSLAVGGSITFTCSVAGSWKSSSQTVLGAKYTTGTTTTTFTAGQLTGAAFASYHSTAATPGSISTRSATEMFADDPYARVGGGYRLRVSNVSTAAAVLTITAGSGVTLTGPLHTVLDTGYRDYIITYTSATALVMQNQGLGLL